MPGATKSDVKADAANPFHPLQRFAGEEALSAFQRGNGGLVVVVQREIEDVQIFRHAFCFARFGEDDNVALDQPAHDDLRHAFAVFRADGGKQRVAEGVVFALGKRRPCLDGDAFAL